MLNKQKGNVMIVVLVAVLWIGGSWIVNLVKLTSCDFESDYKCEVLHLAGLIPPVALVTAWFGTDADKPVVTK